MLSKTKLKHLINKTNTPIIQIVEMLRNEKSGWIESVYKVSENVDLYVWRKHNEKQGTGYIVKSYTHGIPIDLHYDKEDMFYIHFLKELNDLNTWNFNY